MKRHSWNYIAGLFDGEGCIDVQKVYNKTYPDRLYIRPRVRIAMSIGALPLFEELQANFGGYLSHRKAQSEKWQDSVSWEMLSQKDILYFLGNIVDHLVLKKEQAKLAIWWYNNLSGLQTRVVGSWIDEARHVFAEELKAMKRDPQRLSDRAVQRIDALMRQSDPNGDVGTVAEMTTALA